MAELLYNDVKLRALKKEYQALAEADPQRLADLTRDFNIIRATMCTRELAELRPEEFPIDLWAYVTNDQKLQTAARFALFPDDVRADLIKEILTQLDINKSGHRGVLEPFMRA